MHAENADKICKNLLNLREMSSFFLRNLVLSNQKAFAEDWILITNDKDFGEKVIVKIKFTMA